MSTFDPAVARRIAHDLGNLLTVILNGVALARESDDMPKDAIEELEAVERATRSAVQLIGRLRLMGQVEAKPDGVADLSELVRQAAVPPAVVLELWPAPIAVAATAAHVTILVAELVKNAIESTGGHGPVTLMTSTDENAGVLTVTDTGHGVSSDAQPGLGRGLGLAIVSNMVDALGGTFALAGAPGGGTIATIRLPLAAAVDLLPDADAVDAPVLVVDDDPDIRRLLRRLLEREGIACMSAENGTIALEIAEKTPPRLILLDMQMPGLSGTDVLRALRAKPATRATPVILVTARDGVDDKVENLGLGADDYVTKPFEAAELIARVQGVLRRSTALRDVSPLTGLPGNSTILDEISTRLSRHDDFGCLYFDLDGFKGFNDHYGFLRGDEMIRMLGEVLADELGRLPGGFVGHIGGDDFVALCPSEGAEELTQRIIERFDERARALYDAGDRDNGYVELVDRQGITYRQALAAVSIGIVFSNSRVFSSATELADVATEMKSVAKKTPGSAWAVDRRKVD